MQRLLLTIMIFFAAMPLRAADLPTTADIDRAVAAIADYEITRSRGPVSEVERIAAVTLGKPDLRNHLEDRLAQLLEGKCTDDSRDCILSLLAMAGSDRSVDAVARLLTDERWAHPACTVLLGNPSPRAAQALRAALGASKGKALVCIAGAIGDRRDIAATDALVALSSNAEPTVAAAAIVALGKLATVPALARLAELRKNAPADLQASVLDASLNAASRIAAKNPQLAIAIDRELLDGKLPRHVRRGALVGMIQASGAEAVPLVITVIAGNDPDLADTAISQIRLLQADGITVRFSAELPRLAPRLQTLLIEALASRADPAARDGVVAMLKSGDAGVRLAAIRALGTLGDDTTIPLLVPFLVTDGTPQCRAARQSLRRITGPGVDQGLIVVMWSLIPSARAQLIDVMNERGLVSAIPAILKQLDDASADSAVRIAAFRMLAQWAGADALPPVLAGLAACNDESRPDAELAAIAIARRQTDQTSRAQPVVDAMKTSTDAAARGSLLRVLRGIGTAAAYEAVLASTKDANASVQDSAIRALCAWPDARAIPSLMDLGKTTQNATHKVLAMRGVLRLLALNSGLPSDDTIATYRELMSLAAQPDEKKQVLAGLTALSHPAALELATQAAADPAVASEASLAAITVARSIAGLDRQVVAAAMKKLAQQSADAGIKAQAQDVLALTAKFGDYITGWQICGPYFREGI
ncbi:MAG: HEAT repeat domain-containing protein, partial [Tepidisphaeraceae bacterium]